MKPKKMIPQSDVYQELLSQHEGVTRSCCMQFKLDEERTVDIVQDTLVIAIKSLPHYRGKAKLTSWLWSIAQRQIINLFRRESLHKRLEAPQLLRFLSKPILSPEQVAQQHELIQRLHRQIEKLPVTWQRVIRMYYWDQAKTAEIAKHLKIKPSGVRVILHRSRNRLRDHLLPLAG